MSRLWLALGAAAVVACGDDSNGEPDELFPDVAGIYVIQGQFDGIDPSERSFNGIVTIEQETLESSLLTGRADITVTSSGEGGFTIDDAELQDAAVDLAGVVSFSVEDGPISWDFTGERAGDVIEGDHTLTSGDESISGTWSGTR